MTIVDTIADEHYGSRESMAMAFAGREPRAAGYPAST